MAPVHLVLMKQYLIKQSSANRGKALAGKLRVHFKPKAFLTANPQWPAPEPLHSAVGVDCKVPQFHRSVIGHSV